MSHGTIFLFPTCAEAAGLRTRRPDAEWYEIGVGMAEAGARAAQCIAATGCRRAVLCGIAGSVGGTLPDGTVAEVVADAVAGLPEAYAVSYRLPRATALPPVRSLTVSRTGDALPYADVGAGDAGNTAVSAGGEMPLVEQMEGAAVAAACRAFGVELVHLRAISNRVGASRAEWHTAEAVEALGRWAARLAGEADAHNARDAKAAADDIRHPLTNSFTSTI